MIPRRELTRITDTPADEAADPDTLSIFTIRIGQAWVGLPIACVHTIFRIERITPVPLAEPDFVGLLNLRGEITPAFRLHGQLGQPAPEAMEGMLAVGLEACGEKVALVCDEVGDVITLGRSACVELPITPAQGSEMQDATYYRHQDGLTRVLDPDFIFGARHPKRRKAA